MRRAFYGWYVVAASVVVMTLGVGGGLYLFGVLVPSLLAEFPWTHAQVSGANSLAMIVMGLAGPAAGRSVDRYGPRVFMSTSAICSGLGYAAQSLVGRVPALNAIAPPLAQLYACYVLYGLGLAGIGYVPVNTIVSRWFTRRRGLALGVVAVGVGLGGFLTIPTGWLIDAIGWRAATAVIGATIAGVELPLVVLVIRRRTAADVEPDGGANTRLSPLRFDDTPTVQPRGGFLTSWTFWALAVGFGVYTITVTIVRVFGIALLQDKGMTAPDARVVMSALAFWGIVGKIVFGALTDRWPSRIVATAAFALAAVGTWFLLGSATAIAVAAFAVVYGLPMGGIAALQPVLIAEYFGPAAFGIVYGALILLLTLCAAAGPVVAGGVYDLGRGYQPTLVVCIVASGLAATLMLTAKRGAPPTERSVT